MSGVFSKPKQPKLEAEPAEIEPIEAVTEDTEKVRRRERKRLLTGGRESTILSGRAAAVMAGLKKRLGA